VIELESKIVISIILNVSRDFTRPLTQFSCRKVLGKSVDTEIFRPMWMHQPILRSIYDTQGPILGYVIRPWSWLVMFFVIFVIYTTVPEKREK